MRSLLLERRSAAGLTQQQLADALGVSQSYVAKYEGGERRLDVLEFIAVARAVGADPAELVRAIVASDAPSPTTGKARTSRSKIKAGP